MSDTQWESFAKNITAKAVTALPSILEKGSAKYGIAPYHEAKLPDLLKTDLGEKVPLCPYPTSEKNNTYLSLLNNVLKGFQTLSLYSAITFPKRDLQMRIPLVIAELTLTGRWEAYGDCVSRDNRMTPIFHHGLYKTKYEQVQVNVTVNFDFQTQNISQVDLTLTDANDQWKKQPIFDPQKDLIFESEISRGTRKVLEKPLKKIHTAPQLTDGARMAIEHPGLANLLKSLINQMFKTLG